MVARVFCCWVIPYPVLLLGLCCYVLVWITVLCLSIATFVLCFTASKSPCERLINKGSLSLGSSASLPPQTGNRDNLPMLNTKILYPSKCNTHHFPLKQPTRVWVTAAQAAVSTWKHKIALPDVLLCRIHVEINPFVDDFPLGLKSGDLEGGVIVSS